MKAPWSPLDPPLFDRSQLMKGTIEGCVLKLLKRQTSYGYELVTALQEAGFEDMGEGTVYPLLMRLERKGWLKAEFRKSPLGPSRKYFSVTNLGEKALAEFEEHWLSIQKHVNGVLKGQ